MYILPVQASEWPDRPVKVMVPYSAGGPNDILGRKIGQRLSDIWRQPVVIENRGGGNSFIGTEQAAKAPADGYTLLVNTVNVMTALDMENNGFEWRRHFVPVGFLGTHPPYVIVVPARSPIQNYAQLTATARTRPLTYGTPGKGTMHHLYGVWFGNLVKQEQIHVPYKGVAPAVLDLVNGSLDIMFVPVANVEQFIANGTLRAILVLDDNQLDRLPGVPSTRVAKIQDYPAVRPTFMLWAHVNTPAPVLSRIKRDAALAYRMATDDISTIIDPAQLVPQNLMDFTTRSSVQWRELFERTQILK